jgi:hypothetical protein
VRHFASHLPRWLAAAYSHTLLRGAAAISGGDSFAADLTRFPRDLTFDITLGRTASEFSYGPTGILGLKCRVVWGVDAQQWMVIVMEAGPRLGGGRRGTRAPALGVVDDKIVSDTVVLCA